MKIDPFCQRQKCRSLTVLADFIRLMRIFAGVPWEEASYEYDSGVVDKNGNSVFAGYFFGNFRDKANIII